MNAIGFKYPRLSSSSVRLIAALITLWFLTACSSATPVQPLDIAAPSPSPSKTAVFVTQTAAPIPPATRVLQATDTARPSKIPTRSPTISPQPPSAPEQIAVLILDGKQVGAILKTGDLIQFMPDQERITPAVNGRAVLKLIDPLGNWRFNLERTSGTGYRLRDDPRDDYKAYGVLTVYEGRYQVAVRFIGTNFHNGEKIRTRIFVTVQGIAPPATETRPVDFP